MSALNTRNILHCSYCEMFLRLQQSFFLNLITAGSVLAVFCLHGMYNMSLKTDLLNMMFIVPVIYHLAQSQTANGLGSLTIFFLIEALKFHNICLFTRML